MLDDRLLSEICRFFLSYQETLQHICILSAGDYSRLFVLLEGLRARPGWPWTAAHRRPQQDLRLHMLNVRHRRPAPYQAGLWPYLRGESPRWKLCSSQLVSIYSSLSSFPFFKKRMRPQLPLCWVSTPSVVLCFLFFFFQALRHCLVVFLTSHSAQEVCRLKTGPCHCFHSPLRATELNLTPITRLQVPKILTSTHRGLILLLRAIYTEPR